jgi:oligogalacturonide lyase
MYYVRGQQGNGHIIELNIGRLIADSMNDDVKEPAVYERIVAPAPDSPNGTCLTMDADETCMYWRSYLIRSETTIPQPEAPANNDRKAYAAYMQKMKVFFDEKGKGTSVIHKINIQTGKTEKVIDIPFHAGHLQANPWVPGELILCKETGGDADQRIWSVNADGTNFRPVYVETPDEWVTHETMTAPDELTFIISGHNILLREKPSGIATINLRTNRIRLLGEAIEETPVDGSKIGGFWHCNGSPDQRWAVGDTHLGNIILIERSTGKQTLLSSGHPMIPDHAHPIFSPDSKRILIQSALLSAGKNLNLMVLNVP